MKKHYIYILKGTRDFHYCGITNNIARRITQHNAGQSKSTKQFKPLEIIYCREVENISVARMCEVSIKNFGVRRWFEKNNTAELSGLTHNIIQEQLDLYLHQQLVSARENIIVTSVEFLYEKK